MLGDAEVFQEFPGAVGCSLRTDAAKCGFKILHYPVEIGVRAFALQQAKQFGTKRIHTPYYGVSVNWLTIPNAFTLVRILMIPWILRELGRGHWLSGGWLLGGAAFTDLMDGGLARKYGWYSKAGQYLDPIADKLMLTCVYIGLAAGGAAPLWLVGVILGRDAWILGLSAYALRFTKFRNLTPSVWGKLSTFAQVMTAVAIIASRAYGNAAYSRAADVLIWFVAGLAVMSCADYTWRGISYLRQV